MRESLRIGRKLFMLLRDPALRRGLVHGVGAATEVAPLLRDIQPASVIDVGANKGQFALLAATRFPDAPVVAFEPHPKAAATFRKLFAADRRVTLYDFAVSDRDGSAAFHLSGRADCSSLLPIADRLRGTVPGSGGVGSVAVATRRLDSIPSLLQLPRPVLLKLDVQGGELAALRGATRLLETVTYVIVEASFVEFYEGQPLIGELMQWLHGAGFALLAANRPWTDVDGACVQIDLLFAAATRVASGVSQPATIAR